MNQRETTLALEKWRAHCTQVQSLTVIHRDKPETPAERDHRIDHLRASYPDFCEYYFAHWMQLRDKVTGQVIRTIHNAFFHNDAAKKVKNTPNLKAVFEWPRGHAKSTHFDVFLPCWLLFQKQRLLNVMVVVGKSEDAARQLLSDLQAELEFNQRLIADYGEQKNIGDWTDGEFVTRTEAAFFARGRGQSPRGLRYKNNRPDYIVIDDLDDDELDRNPSRVSALTDWVKEALFGALDAGRGRFIMVGNLISKTSVLQNIINTPGVITSKICALDKNGAPVWTEKWSPEEAAQAAQFMGYRAWQKEMMHNPIIEGTVFKNDWIRWKPALPLSQYEQIVLYIDPSWKSTKKDDYKVAQVWGKPRPGHKGYEPTELHHLRAFCRQCSFHELVVWVYDFHERLPQNAIVSYYMEASFMQDLILDEFTAEGNVRGYQLPLTPDRRKKPDKFARIESISPLWERGFVYYADSQRDDPDMKAALDQTLAFQQGANAHDDAPDADEGAIWILQRTARVDAFPTILGHRHPPKGSW
jgi:predicted phage terminase large subunit-like protein